MNTKTNTPNLNSQTMISKTTPVSILTPWKSSLKKVSNLRQMLIRNMITWKRNMIEILSNQITPMKQLLCNMRLTLLTWKINSRKLKRCSSKVKLLGPKKKPSSNRNLNSCNINLKMKRRNRMSKDRIMTLWSRVFNLPTENLWLEEKKPKSKSMRWNKSSWTKGRSKRHNTMGIEKLLLTKLNSLKSKKMKLNCPRNLQR